MMLSSDATSVSIGTYFLHQKFINVLNKEKRMSFINVINKEKRMSFINVLNKEKRMSFINVLNKEKRMSFLRNVKVLYCIVLYCIVYVPNLNPGGGVGKSD
jgi:hypothetical protein